MSLKDRWIHLIYRTATGSRKIRLLITPIVALSYFLFASLFVILSFPTDRLLGLPDLLPPSISAVLSIPVIFLGLFLAFWSVLHFFQVRGGTPVPFNPPPELVTSGPYAHARNPMLSGLFILLFGLGLAFRSVSLSFIFTPLFILVNVMEVKTIEEPELEMRLGQRYLEYKKRTPMFFPWRGSER
ncbi:MAG: isoprenylcysteine carboxylmethyltransferase family protein [Deltaproteobacteria bacterium]|nr:isoprenylcysteine carboxylmethyltransferase family protein [Deltaproteobacteria bacterium]